MKKIIKRIIIGNLIISVISGLAIFTALLIALDSAEIIDLDDFGIIDKFSSSSSSKKSASIEAMLKSCQDIAQFYATAEPRYTYNSKSPPWDTHYKDGQYHTSCCSIYVLQVFVDIGLTDSLGDLEAAYVGRFCESHPEDWEKFVAGSEADLEPGDVQIYNHHTNIFAGFNSDGIR